MAKLISIPDAAAALGQTERHLRRLCAAGRISGAVKDGGEWQIPKTYDTRLHGVEQPVQNDPVRKIKYGQAV